MSPAPAAKTAARPRSMIVAGVMSGTSADGVDVAFTRIAPGLSAGAMPRLKLLGHRSFAYTRSVRQAVLAVMNAESISVAELARIDWRLGEIYADAVERSAHELGLTPALIGLHGQTIYHQAAAAAYLGRPTRATWQIGEAAVIGARLRVPVVSDFRPADLAAGGQGAPLVPMLDVCLFRSARVHRVLLNLGGIANLTAIPAGAALHQVLAFDTGPANMVIDALMQQHFGRSFDRAGRTAARGRIVQAAVDEALHQPFTAQAPPKSFGREQFGAAYVDWFTGLCADASPADLIATATELTARSIHDAYLRFVRQHLAAEAPSARRTELIVSGGGVRNLTLMRRLAQLFDTQATVSTADQAGMPAQAKEAVAFALLAWLRWHGLPGNVPAATGATRDAVLGMVSLW